MIISSGGVFACRWMDTKEEFKLKLPMARSTSYKSYEEDAGKCQNDHSVYCEPLSQIQTAFEAPSYSSRWLQKRNILSTQSSTNS